jgi:hypothetical protein
MHLMNCKGSKKRTLRRSHIPGNKAYRQKTWAIFDWGIKMSLVEKLKILFFEKKR